MSKQSQEDSNMDKVVKTNRLNTCIQNLSLAELRLIQLAIVDAREKQQGLSADKPLFISALRYAERFEVEKHTAYEVLKQIEKTLFDRRFTFVNERKNEVKSRWISQVEYHRGEGGISIILTPAVVNEITRIDGFERAFTEYLLEQTAVLNSVYSVRLYELVVQWKNKTTTFDLGLLREQLGLGVNDYNRMSDFKRRVFNLAINEINDKTDLEISYKNKKRGRNIIGFEITTKQKRQPKQQDDIKAQNGDMFTVGSYSDAQLARITRSPAFIKDYASKISPNSDMNKDMSLWTAHFVQELKKDASQFNKRPIKDYLDY